MYNTCHEKTDLKQGWKLQTVRLSGLGKNIGGQVTILDTCLQERL